MGKSLHKAVLGSADFSDLPCGLQRDSSTSDVRFMRKFGRHNMIVMRIAILFPDE